MKFEKVSLDQYIEDAKEDQYITRGKFFSLSDMAGDTNVEFENNFSTLKSTSLDVIYDRIKLPARGTKKSAGYDFFSPYDFRLAPGETIRIATGIRFDCDPDKFLCCCPRSGHGFKYRLQLDNTIAIIDADYYESSNEGHIMIKITNDSRTGSILSVKEGDAILQGIILPYFKVDDDGVSRQRDGGFGSTNK